MPTELPSGRGSLHGGASSQSPVVLFLAANPVRLPRLELGEECRSIEEKIRAANGHHQLRFRSRWAARPDDLLQALNEDSPSVLHFSGHGTGDQGICFQADDGGILHVTAEGLARVLRAAGKGVSVVLLNACYSESQAEVLVSHVPCVIGLPAAIGDGAAIVYSASFYRALAFGKSVANAHEQGVAALSLPRVDGPMRDVNISEPAEPALTPRLLARPDVDPDSLYLVTNATERTHCTIVIKATINDCDGEVIARITEELRKYTGDILLRIKKIKKGSVKLLVELSPEALDVLVGLRASNKLERLDRFEVVDVILPRAEDDVSDGPGNSTAGERNAELSSAERSALDRPSAASGGAQQGTSATLRAERPLLHVWHAPSDEGWVYGEMIPRLGLARDQVRTLLDYESGQSKVGKLERALDESRITVMVISPASYRNDLLAHATDLALHATAETATPRIVFLTRGVPLESLSLTQRSLVGLDCSSAEATAVAMAKLREFLELKEPVFVRPKCPYPGLNAFQASDRNLLFGRDQDRDEIVGRIHGKHQRILLLGPSGSGKSSLIRAAVLPALSRDEYLVEVVPEWPDLIAALRSSLAGLQIDRLVEAVDGYAAAVTMASPKEPSRKIEKARRQLDALVRPDSRRRVLVIDPLEAIFTDHDSARRTAFFHMLRAVWNRPWCTVILCLRSDFRGRLRREPCAREIDDSSMYRLPDLSESGLRAAIEEPARSVDVHVEPALVERLIQEVAQDRSTSALPNLQVALEQLWGRLEHRYMTLNSYDSIVQTGPAPDAPSMLVGSYGESAIRHARGLAAMVSVHAEQVLQTLSIEQQAIAMRIVLELVHPGEGRSDTQRHRTPGQLRRRGDSAEDFDRVLGVLVDGRLITAVGERSGVEGARHVQLAHDALIHGWVRLANLVEQNRQALIKDRQIEAYTAQHLGWRAATLERVEDGTVSASAPASGTPPSRVDRKREREVLAYVHSGQREVALKILMVIYGDLLAVFLSRLVSDPARIRHIYQQSFLRAFREIHRFRPAQYDSVLAWLCQLTWETFVEGERPHARRGSVIAPRAYGESDAAGAPVVVAERVASPESLMDTDPMHRLEQYLMELPWRLRAQPLMRLSLGLSYTEIGTAMGIDAGTVERNVSQIQPWLRRRMGAKGGVQ